MRVFDVGLFLILIAIFILALLLSPGCGVRDQLPRLSGPVSQEGLPVNPDKQKIEGIGVERRGDVLLVTWSVPVVNDVSPLPAIATATCRVRVIYAANGCPTEYESAEPATLVVNPSQTRLISGQIIIPRRNLAEGDTDIRFDPLDYFDRADYSPVVSGRIISAPELELEYASQKDGQVTLRWRHTVVSVTHQITATAKNAKSVSIDTADYPLRAVLILVDKDGREITRASGEASGEAGKQTVEGWITAPLERLLLIDGNRCHIDWQRQLPEDKPQSDARTIHIPVRAYCPCQKCCGARAQGITAAGTWAYSRGVAAACLPRGTGLRIPGYGYARVDDTGGALRRQWRRGEAAIEVRFDEHRQAIEWGVQWLPVTVISG